MRKPLMTLPLLSFVLAASAYADALPFGTMTYHVTCRGKLGEGNRADWAEAKKQGLDINAMINAGHAYCAAKSAAAAPKVAPPLAVTGSSEPAPAQPKPAAPVTAPTEDDKVRIRCEELANNPHAGGAEPTPKLVEACMIAELVDCATYDQAKDAASADMPFITDFGKELRCRHMKSAVETHYIPNTIADLREMVAAAMGKDPECADYTQFAVAARVLSADASKRGDADGFAAAQTALDIARSGSAACAKATDLAVKGRQQRIEAGFEQLLKVIDFDADETPTATAAKP